MQQFPQQELSDNLNTTSTRSFTRISHEIRLRYMSKNPSHHTSIRIDVRCRNTFPEPFPVTETSGHITLPMAGGGMYKVCIESIAATTLATEYTFIDHYR